ncbi:hypothetical protein [Kangiella sediminilitoris]|uniref:Uncharacterized protein n=1 Tax=Kangiella sediminilitoris TaxID=1144748 RepID=A0A1B3BBF3_9GAMM|nr:hypothetical protein [Kangiella sediminilitoris]AOE50124.1 hypothetical protein KS2013_1412 [Kangiella sediminilitoris]
MNKVVVIVISMLIASVAYAGNEDRDALSVDKVTTQGIDFHFPNDDNIQPEESDFEILNYVTMSNEYGERKVVVTLENTSTGNRIFSNEQIMALYANGSRRVAHEKRIGFKGKEVKTLTLSFHISKYPILKVYTRH